MRHDHDRCPVCWILGRLLLVIDRGAVWWWGRR